MRAAIISIFVFCGCVPPLVNHYPLQQESRWLISGTNYSSDCVAGEEKEAKCFEETLPVIERRAKLICGELAWTVKGCEMVKFSSAVECIAICAAAKPAQNAEGQ